MARYNSPSPNQRLIFELRCGTLFRQELVDRERSSKRYHEGGGVRDPGARDQLNDVVVERGNRDGVLVSAESVDGVREVGLGIGATFRGRHHLELARGLDHPLPLLPVTDQVRLQKVGPKSVAVASDDGTGLFKRLEVKIPKQPRARRKDARARNSIRRNNVC